eukprot:UN01582
MSALYILLICYAFFNNASDAEMRIQIFRQKTSTS